MAGKRDYTVVLPATAFSAIRTIWQILVPATTAIELISCFLAQTSTTTNAQQEIEILRKTAVATVTSVTPSPINPNDPASLCVGGVSATGINASAEGTDGTVIVHEAFSLLTGWVHMPETPEDRIVVPPSGIIAVKFPVAPGTVTFVGELKFRELA